MYDSSTNLKRARDKALLITVRKHSVIDDFALRLNLKIYQLVDILTAKK